MSSIEEIITHPALVGLAMSTLPETQSSLNDIFLSLEPNDQSLLATLFLNGIEGPHEFGIATRKGIEPMRDEKIAYDILKNKLSTPLLYSLEEILKQSGYMFRFPRALTTSLIHYRNHYAGFEDIEIDLAESKKHDGICADGELVIYRLKDANLATVLTHKGIPIMLASFVGFEKKYGAVCLRDFGPFVRAVIYSPQYINTDVLLSIQEKFTDSKVDIRSISKQWNIVRPIWGFSYSEDYKGPIYTHESSNELMRILEERL